MKVYKTPYGWKAKSFIKQDGILWDTITMKRSNGQLVSTATECTYDGIAITIQWDAKRKQPVIHDAKRVTEKAVKEAHERALRFWESQDEPSP
jgi:hypothetical protein